MNKDYTLISNNEELNGIFCMKEIPKIKNKVYKLVSNIGKMAYQASETGIIKHHSSLRLGKEDGREQYPELIRRRKSITITSLILYFIWKKYKI